MDLNLTTLSFAWCFIAGACLVLATRERHSRGALPLALAIIASGATSTLGLWGWDETQALLKAPKVLFLTEACLPFLWSMYGASLAGRLSFRRSISASIFLAFGILSLVGIAAFTNPSEMLFNPDYGTETVLFIGPIGFYFYLMLTTYLIAALAIFERVFAGMSRNNRWRLKFEIIGIGAIITIQIVFYSQALMYRTLDFALNPARNIAMVAGLILFLYTRFFRGYPEKLSVSPTVAYRSLILLAASVYLIFMGLVGEGLRFFGPSSNRLFVLVLALFCGVALFAVCLSDQLRRKARVFIHKNFYQHRYDYRDKWLEMTRRLNSRDDELSLGLTILEMYCQTFALKGGTLVLRNSDHSDFMPVVGYEWGDIAKRIRADGALSTFFQRTHWVFNRAENLEEINNSKDATLIDQFAIFFAVPLFCNDQLIGIILLGEQINKDELFIYEDYDLMKTLASQCSSTLHNLHLRDQLVDTREMAAIGKVSTFVMHDLKNLVSNLALVIDNAQNHINNKDFQKDMVETLDNSVSRMKSLIDRLKKLEVIPSLALESCDLQKLVEETLRESVVVDFELNGDPVDLNVDRREMSRVILNLAKNGMEAMGKTRGVVKIKTGINGRAFLTVQDQGCGMTEEFIEKKLFKPFETTKSKGFGVGLYQCRQIVEAHGGELEVESQPGQGSVFTVWLPTTQG